MFDYTRHGICSQIIHEPSLQLWGKKWDSTAERAPVSQDSCSTML